MDNPRIGSDAKASAGAPQNGLIRAVGSARFGGPLVYCIATGVEMDRFDNSRFGDFYSRLGGKNSRFGRLREFGRKSLISGANFGSEQRFCP
jgi:hypothetical protein